MAVSEARLSGLSASELVALAMASRSGGVSVYELAEVLGGEGYARLVLARLSFKGLVARSPDGRYVAEEHARPAAEVLRRTLCGCG